MPDIRLPDGRLIKNVPEGTSKADLISKLKNNNVITGDEEWVKGSDSNVEPETEVANNEKSSFEITPEAAAERRQEFKRYVGLGIRTLGQGFGSVALPASLAAVGVNAKFDTNIQPLSNVVSEGLTAMGVPEANTPGERMFVSAGEGLVGGGLFGRVAKVSPNKFIRKFGNPRMEAAAGTGAGLAGQATEEAGGGPIAQIAASLIGGGLAIKGVNSAASKLSKASASKDSLLGDVAERGVDETQAFSSVRDDIIKQADVEDKRIDILFEEAKKRGQKAFIPNKKIQNLSNDLKNNIVKVTDIDGKKFIETNVSSIDDLAKSNNISNTINELHSFRRQASKIVRKDRSGSEGAKIVLEKIDKFLENAPIQGDQQAASLWKRAIEEKRSFGKRFQDPKKIAQAIDEDVTVESVEKIFLGNSAVSTQNDLAKTYDDALRAVKPEKRKEVGFALRQSALNKMINNAVKAQETAEGISASRLSNSIRNLRRDNRSFWNKFPEAEAKELKKLEVELRKVSKGGAINKVYTALEKILRRAALGSNIELPRTLKAKTIVEVEDLLELSKTSPRGLKALLTPAVVGVDQSISGDN